MKTILSFLLLSLISAPITAQSLTELKKQLREKETAAGKDPGALVEVASWAKEKGLVRDMQRILQAVLKLDKDNEKANGLLGFVKHEGEWMPKAKAEAAIKKALAEEMKAKGMIQVEDIWVTKDEVADAKKGIFWHEGERVSKFEKNLVIQGLVRHSVTGEFIRPDDQEKAEQGLFPLGDRWGAEEEADKYHANRETPWVYRSQTANIVSTRKLAQIKELAIDLDSAVGDASRVFAGLMPTPANRPLVLIAEDEEHYKALGAQVGAEGSAHGVFLSDQQFEVKNLGQVRPTIMNWRDDWGPYWVRHAAGLAWTAGVAADLGMEFPLWFSRGVAGYVERFSGPGVAQHFGREHLKKGGVNGLAAWFNGFAISPELEPRMIDFNVFQAGLLFSYAMDGGDPDATAALTAVTTAARAADAKQLQKAIEQFQATLTKSEEGLRNHLRKLVNI